MNIESIRLYSQEAWDKEDIWTRGDVVEVRGKNFLIFEVSPIENLEYMVRAIGLSSCEEISMKVSSGGMNCPTYNAGEGLVDYLDSI